MKIAVDFYNDTLKTIYEDKAEDLKKGCYFVNLENEVLLSLVRKIKKGSWQQLKDEHGKLLWDDSSTLKPEMGFEVEDRDTEINIKNHLSFWTIKEILEAKYSYKRSIVNNTCVYYEEFLDEEFFMKLDGSLNRGKKVFYGNGIIEHNFKLANNKIVFDCEYEGRFPKLSISLDGKTFVKVEQLPFVRDFRRTTFKNVYLKMLDWDNKLTAYSFFYNEKSKTKLNQEFIGRGFLR